MLPTVFLSLEGTNEGFVAQVQRFLPDGLAYFYPRSFANGEALISAMEDRVGKASLFVLFTSKKAVKSPWVGFEIDKARLAKIKDPKFRIIVVALDHDVTHADLPGWMRDYWVDRQEVYAVGRTAMLMMRRDQNFSGAKTLLTGQLQRGIGGQVYIRRLRAIAAANEGDMVTAREDADFLKSRGVKQGTHGIEARILLAQGDFDGALRELAKGGSATPQDELLRARILEVRANTTSTPFGERDALRRQAAEIRAKNRMLDEYEVER